MRRLLWVVLPAVLGLATCLGFPGVDSSGASQLTATSQLAATSTCGLLSEAQMSSALGETIHSTSVTGTASSGFTCTYWVHASDNSASTGSLLVVANSARAATAKKYHEPNPTTVAGFAKDYFAPQGRCVRVKGLGEIAAYCDTTYGSNGSSIYVLTAKETFSVKIDKVSSGAFASIPEPTLASLARDVLKKL